ncbi:catalase [Colletotrichum gloeosporioides Cg-14]|uniref:Catalase n=1 Tax=Colletotrichum gloeosporioides (strain Cg-14) TaxID=1237896 RepID=T0K2U3_COLGC|nr:catalase [Colletotrichum gloeosporioides Cg-14]
MDDWQDAAFSTRHVHNRVGKSKAGRGRGRRGGGAFEVKRTFGRYEVKCANAKRIGDQINTAKNKGQALLPTIEIFRLSDDGRGLLGRLCLPGVLDASLVMTGSRKTLEELVSGLEARDDITSESEIEDEPGDRVENEVESGASDVEQDVESDDNAVVSETETKEKRRFESFEKNSFRSPKFWFQWKGQVTSNAESSTAKSNPEGSETGRGYVVFSGNDCRSFKGTITVDALQWKDVSLSGWKEVTMPERDVGFDWK